MDEIQTTVVGVWIFSGTTQYKVLESDERLPGHTLYGLLALMVT